MDRGPGDQIGFHVNRVRQCVKISSEDGRNGLSSIFVLTVKYKIINDLLKIHIHSERLEPMAC